MKVIGIGDNVVDDYVHTRIYYPGGNALNFAVYAAMLRHQAAFLGVFGNDAAARHVEATLKTCGIDASRCLHAKGENGHARLEIRDGDRVFLGSNDGGIRKTTSMDFVFNHLDYIRDFALIHTSAYSYIDTQLERLHELGVPISYDFSDDFEAEAAVALCRHVDHAFFSCAERTEAETRAILESAIARGARTAVATRGAEGATLFDGTTWYQQSPDRVEPVDTLGAGDAFITAFLLAYLDPTARRRAEEAGHLRGCLAQAAVFAAKICLVNGAFGYGAKY